MAGGRAVREPRPDRPGGKTGLALEGSGKRRISPSSG